MSFHELRCLCGHAERTKLIIITAIKQIEDFSFRKPVGICLGQTPHIDPTLFVGRESELDEMKDLLKPGDKSQEQRRLVLGGMGGIGKTQLAIAYANRHRSNYESVFWLNATSEAALRDSFRSMAELIFDVQTPEAVEGEQSLIRIRGWLSDKKNTQWMLIFDNYDDPSRFKIENYYPLASHGAIVITTRRPDLVAGMKVQITSLQNVEEGLEILQSRSLRKDVKSGMVPIVVEIAH